MSYPHSDGTWSPPSITCAKYPGFTHDVSFEGSLGGEGVLVTVGQNKGVMFREEIAALAALFPVIPKKSQ